MASKAAKKPTKSATPGPQPDRLKVDGNWKDAVKKSFEKKKPAEGWPK